MLEHSGKAHAFVADSVRFLSMVQLNPANGSILPQYDLSNPPIFRTRGHRFSVTAAVASEDARWLYTSGKDGWIIKWDMHTGKMVHVFHKVKPSQDLGKGKGKAKADPTDLDGHTDEIWALALSPDGRLLASGGKDRRIGVWDVNEDKWVKGFSGHRDSISVSYLDIVAAAPI